MGRCERSCLRTVRQGLHEIDLSQKILKHDYVDGMGNFLLTLPLHAMCIGFCFSAEVFWRVTRAPVVRERGQCALGID